MVVAEAAIIAAASARYQGEQISQLLLDQRGSEVVVTKGVLIAAASNEEQGKAIIQPLLEQRGGEVVITEGVLVAAIGNWGQGTETTGPPFLPRAGTRPSPTRATQSGSCASSILRRESRLLASLAS